MLTTFWLLVQLDKDPRFRAYSPEFTLRDHEYPVGCVSWSLDDAILLTASENRITLWNAKVGYLPLLRGVDVLLTSDQSGAKIRTLEQHTDVVTALTWLPDGSGFISGGLDRKIILWVRLALTPPSSMRVLTSTPPQDVDGKPRDTWQRTSIRVTDLMVSPNFTRLVAVGMYDVPSIPQPAAAGAVDGAGAGAAAGAGGAASGGHSSETQIVVYDLATKQPESCVHLSVFCSASRVPCLAPRSSWGFPSNGFGGGGARPGTWDVEHREEDMVLTGSACTG